MSIASDDFRDGAASGAKALSDRLIRMYRWGVPIEPVLIAATATDIMAMMGGKAIDIEPEAK
jgi:hypothetical protein